MTILNNSQLNIIRSEYQASDVYLAVYKPNVVMTALINDPNIINGAKTITIDNIVGSITNVKENSTLYIGTVPLGKDVGRVRVRSASGTSVTVAVDYDIPYQDNLYLTFTDFHEIWPVFPKVDLNTGTLTTTFYKDWDIPYTNDNSKFSPVPILGPHIGGFYDTHNPIYFTATGSYCLTDSISSYLWTFPTGCSITSSTSVTPGNVTFPNYGFFTVSCQVTSNQGKSTTGFRHICLMPRTRPTPDFNMPFYFEIESLEGDWDNGWSAKIKVKGRASEFYDGALAVIFREDTYGTNHQSFGGFGNREQVLFVGYVSQVDNSYGFDESDFKATIYLKGPSSYLQNKEMFSVSIDDVSTASNWNEIENLTINKFINHYLRWHSTLYSVHDVFPVLTEHGNYRENICEVQKGELFTNISNFLKQRIFANFTSDKQGTIYQEVDLNMLGLSLRPSPTMTFEARDWLIEPTYTEIIENNVSNVLMGGEAYNPPTETGTAFLSRAPGEWQTYTGKSENISGLTLLSQSHLNELSGLYLAKVNNDVNKLTLKLSYNFTNLDVVPQEYINHYISGTQIFRDEFVNWQPKQIIPRKISIEQKPFRLLHTIEFEPESYGIPGATVNIPTEAPTGEGTPCDDCNPPPPPPDPGGNGGVVYVATMKNVARTRNFLDSSPNWSDITGIIDTNSHRIYDFNLNPFNPANEALVVTDDKIYYTNNLKANNPTWQITELTTGLAPMIIGATVERRFVRCAFTIASPNRVYVKLVTKSTALSPYKYWILRSDDGGQTWTDPFDTTASPRDTTGENVLYCGQHNGNVVYVGQSSNAGCEAILRSDNAGQNWGSGYGVPAPSNFRTIIDLECPYAGNDANDNRVIIWENLSCRQLSQIQINTATKTTFTPTYSSVGTDILPYKILTATTDAQRIYCLRGAAAEYKSLDRSEDQGSTWSQDLQTNLRYATALGGWPFDANYVEWLDMGIFPSTTAMRIMISYDKGVTAANKIGDWQTAVNSTINNHLTHRGLRIIPLWVAE